MKFGEFLIENAVVSKTAIQEAINLQKYRRIKLGRLLQELGALSKAELNTQLQNYIAKPWLGTIEELQKACLETTKSDSLQEILKGQEIIVFESGQGSCSCIVKHFDDDIAKKIEGHFPKINYYLVDSETFEVMCKKSPERLSRNSSKISLQQRLTDDQRASSSDPFARLFKECMESAVKFGVSDIHFEPEETTYKIKFRKNGERFIWKTLPIDLKDALTAKFKSLLNLDLAVVGAPQDSRASFPSLGVDVRVNCLPVIYGEKIVLRLLEQNFTFDLSRSGLNQQTLNDLSAAAKKRDGLILISGPTGSGKTTTLYSLINLLDSTKKNISTLENPVEYRLPGVNQVEVGGRNLSFANSLRALMRQDPDVILVGEVRDTETAQLCFKAASTGHLVFSTVHANGAKEVIERLLNLGIDELSIKSNLRLSAAQRLVRKLCSCGIPINETKHLPVKLERPMVQNRSGCSECSSGIIGRIPIIEYLNSKEIEHFITQGGSGQTESTTSLRKQVIHLASQGLIDAEEALELI